MMCFLVMLLTKKDIIRHPVFGIIVSGNDFVYLERSFSWALIADDALFIS